MKAKRSFLSRNLKFLRKLKGITQNELAKELELSRNKIASYESGIAEPKILNFIKLATYFNIDPYQLLIRDLSNNSITVQSDDYTSDQVSNNLNEMIKATQELQKIIEGYKLFQEMRKISMQSDDNSKILLGQLNNIIDLNQSILSLNWDFIRTMTSFEEE